MTPENNLHRSVCRNKNCELCDRLETEWRATYAKPSGDSNFRFCPYCGDEITSPGGCRRCQNITVLGVGSQPALAQENKR